jgi:hypothetical protein
MFLQLTLRFINARMGVSEKANPVKAGDAKLLGLPLVNNHDCQAAEDKAGLNRLTLQGLEAPGFLFLQNYQYFSARNPGGLLWVIPIPQPIHFRSC